MNNINILPSQNILKKNALWHNWAQHREIFHPRQDSIALIKGRGSEAEDGVTVDLVHLSILSGGTENAQRI